MKSAWILTCRFEKKQQFEDIFQALGNCGEQFSHFIDWGVFFFFFWQTEQDGSQI